MNKTWYYEEVKFVYSEEDYLDRFVLDKYFKSAMPQDLSKEEFDDFNDILEDLMQEGY